MFYEILDNTMIHKITENSKIIILFILILLASLFVSCSGMRPPGFHNAKVISEKSNISEKNEKKNENIDKNKDGQSKSDFELSRIEEFEKNIKQNSENKITDNDAADENIIQPDEVVAGTPIMYETSEETSDNSNMNNKSEQIDYSEKLSTLNNQMDEIRSKQKKSDEKFEKLQSKISNLESRIAEIESKPEKKQSVKPVRSATEKRDNNFIIKPDEKLTKTKKVKVSYENTEPVIDNNQDRNRFEAGIKFFNAGKFALAIQTLKEIENDKVKDLSNPVNYYIAKSYFNTEDYSSALMHLDKIINNSESNYKPESHFLKAECLIKSGKADKAREIFKEFVSIYPANKFTPQARKMLQKL